MEEEERKKYSRAEGLRPPEAPKPTEVRDNDDKATTEASRLGFQNVDTLGFGFLDVETAMQSSLAEDTEGWTVVGSSSKKRGSR